MSDELKNNWKQIVEHFEKSLQSSRFFTFATTNPDGSPHMAPYASLVLGNDCTGYYSDVFPNRMSRNLKRDPRICISAVDMGMGVWLKALFSGKFQTWPAVRLYGTVGTPRKATLEETERWRHRLKKYKWTKGYKLLWADIKPVRDIQFDRFEPIHLGPMT
jgi:predicted pyridoxine 5'-phosphate oxidase superfamily flavin-nucleotide-binding protein